MRKIDILMNEIEEIKIDFENKIDKMDVNNWNTNSLINSIVAYYECSDDIATASRAFWAEDSIRKNLSEKEKIELFNKAKSIDGSLVWHGWDFDKKYIDFEQFNNDYNIMIKEIESYKDAMVHNYSSYINFEELDGLDKAVRDYKVIQRIKNGYDIFLKYDKAARTIKLYKVIQNAKEKEFTGDEFIDKLLTEFYSSDWDNCRSYLNRRPAGIMVEIGEYLNERINKIKPEFEYKYYDVYPGKDEDTKIIGMTVQHLRSVFTWRIRTYNPIICNKLGSAFKYMLSEVEKLENTKDKNSLNYKCDWYKLNKLFYIFR